MSSDDVNDPNTSQSQSVHNMEDLQSELESVSSALMSSPTIPLPVIRVESNDDGEGPLPSKDLTPLLPPPSTRPIIIPPPNFPVEVGELAVSPSTVRITSEEQLGSTGLNEMHLRIGVTSVSVMSNERSYVNERPPEPPAKFMTAEVSEDVASPGVEDAIVEQASPEEPNAGGKQDKYICRDCGKSFSYKMSWINHKLTHEGVAPYQCERCGKSFAYGSSVHNHMKIPGRCKGRMSARKSAPSTVTSERKTTNGESSESPVKEANSSNEQSKEKKHEDKALKGKPKASSEARSPTKVNSRPGPKSKTMEERVEVPVAVPVVPRKRGRPPKHPRPATAPSPASSAPALPVAAPPRRGEDRMSLDNRTHQDNQDKHRSRSQRKIQPPIWMRNMEMDYEIPVTSGIFLGDNSRPVSTGASWREVNSITHQKRRRSAGDSVSEDDDYPALQREDIVDETICNGLASKNGRDSHGESSTQVANNQHGSDSASEPPIVEPEVRIPKKRGRKKKVVEPPNLEQVVSPHSTTADAQSKGGTLPVPNLTPINVNPNSGQYDSNISPTKRSLRGLPHRSEMIAQSKENLSTPIPLKKPKLERSDEPEEDLEDTLPMEEDEEQTQEVEGNQENEELEDEEEEEDEDDEDNEEEDMEEQMDEMEGNEEEEQTEEIEDGEGEQIEIDEGENNITEGGMIEEDVSGTNHQVPMGGEENQNYQEEEEEEDTDVVEGSDNEESPPPPPAESSSNGTSTPSSTSVQSGSRPAGPVAEYDLKSAAINFLYKKISNRNMHRIRRELMELTDRGDYFQLTQWAPLAAGLLQAMLLRNFD